MTLAALWLDCSGDGQRLCIASDSRTTPGPIDGVTKVLLFGREDVAGVWAGDYRYAALLASHLDAVFTGSDAMRSRDVDLSRALAQARVSVRSHLDEAVKKTGGWSSYLNEEARQPERTDLVVAGYSLLLGEFCFLRIQYVPNSKRWKLTTGSFDSTTLIFLGDERPRAKSWARQARAYVGAVETWRMEPLQAIHRAIVDSRFHSIGGVPQMVKVFMHGRALPYGFQDPATGKIWSRATIVSKRGGRELAASRRLIDLASWRLGAGRYAGGDPPQ